MKAGPSFTRMKLGSMLNILRQKIWQDSIVQNSKTACLFKWTYNRVKNPFRERLVESWWKVWIHKWG
jgi:hypothetical protein